MLIEKMPFVFAYKIAKDLELPILSTIDSKCEWPIATSIL